LLLLLGHITDATCCDRCSVVLLVGLLVSHSCAKVTEPIVMQFRMWIWVGPRNHILDGGPDPGSHTSLFQQSLKLYYTCILPVFLYALNAGQSPRMQDRCS